MKVKVLFLLTALLLVATVLKADTLVTVAGAYPINGPGSPTQFSFDISFQWNPKTLFVVPGRMDVSAPLVFSAQNGDFLAWRTANWSTLGTFLGYDVEIGCFYINCGAYTSDNWSIPGDYGINDMRFVYSYIGGWTDYDVVCPGCSVNVSTISHSHHSDVSDVSDVPEPSTISMILVGIALVFLAPWRRRRSLQR